jgi:ferredoxin-NADP reductase
MEPLASPDTASAPATALATAAAAVWGDDDEWLRCVQVRQETHDVRSFVFRAESPRSFRYRPGQYITLGLPLAGGTIYRCYTLASSPTRPDTVSITVKRVPGGPSSNWLHDEMKPGMRLAVHGPGGAFSCFGAAGEPPAKGTAPLLFLSGGSGITPLMSMARAFHDLGHDADIVFVHAARTPRDIVFAEELALMARMQPRFRLAVVCEQRGDVPGYAGHLGRLSLPMLQSMAPDFLQRDTYCCGPAPFMAAVRAMLPAGGYDMAKYREESFAFETLETAPVPATALNGHAQATTPEITPTPSFEIRLAKLGDVFRCSGEQTVLEAATAAGVRMPSSCRSGMCGTCRTVKVSGEVEMQHNGGLRPREVKQGWFLPCCSRPLSDLVLDR